jgi:5'-3' exoribonuclease 2
MPHFPSANIRTGGIDKILQAYKNVLGNTNETLCKGTVVQWKNVRKLVQVLAQQEEENMKQEMKLRDKREKFKLPNSTPEEKYKQFDAIPIYERALEKHIQPYKEGWQDRYYSALFSLQKENVEAKKRISLCFLEGLEWTLKYYTQGCPDWRWSYPYAYPPLFSDLLCEIPYFEKELVVQKTPEPVLPLVQLCYVLPRDSLTFLTPKLYDYLMRHHSDWYSNDCEFLWAFCKYFWESHVILPEIDMKVLENIVEKKMYL